MTIRMCLRVWYSALGRYHQFERFGWIEYGGGFVCVWVVGIICYVDIKQCCEISSVGYVDIPSCCFAAVIQKCAVVSRVVL